MKTAKEYFETCLGGNMNIATLRPVVFVEIMEEYAAYLAKHVAKQALQDAAKNAKIIFIDGKTKEQTSHLMLYSGEHCMMPDTDLILNTEIKLP